MSSMLIRGYFKPGVPWLGFTMLLLWGALEAAVFTYTLEPRITTLMADLSGSDESRFTVPILYAFVLALVLASFACVQALINAARTKDPRFIAQIIGIELFTICFEVMFLYRGLVEVTMPWIAKDNGATVATAAVGWFGVRGLTWFLFGQYGTPPLLALIARRPRSSTRAAQPTRWQVLLPYGPVLLVSLIVGHRTKHRMRIIIDAENYRERREENLRSLALRVAQQVRNYRRSIALEAMPPHERRIVRERLFFFFDYDGQRNTLPNPVFLGVQPSTLPQRKRQSTAVWTKCG